MDNKKQNCKKIKIRYYFENKLANSPLSLVKIIALVTLIVSLIVSILIFVLCLTESESFSSIYWDTLAYSINAWLPFTSDGDYNTIRILLTAISSVFGLFVTSLLIGVISSFLEQKVDEMKKGNSFVYEEGHIAILGFIIGEYTLLKEIIKNINGKKQTILIVSDSDGVEVIDAIKSNIEIPRNIKLVCRNIDICDIESLRKCSLNTCKSIIISPLDDKKTIKCIYCISSILKNVETKVVTVATIRDERYLLPKNFLDQSGVFILALSNFVSRIVAQTSNQPGLALLYLDLFNYKGSELYIYNPKGIANKTFKEVLLKLDKGVPIGIENNDGIIIKPDCNYRIKSDDKLIVYSENDDSAYLTKSNTVINETIPNSSNDTSANKKVLILGFNDYVEELIAHLSNDNCELYYCSDIEHKNINFGDKLAKNYSNEYRIENYLDLTKMVKEIDRIVVLNNHDNNREEADLDVMLLLTRLRTIRKDNNLKYTIVVELRSAANRSLIHKNDYTDYIVRTNIISMFLAQLSLKPGLYPVFDELLSPDGHEIRLIQANKLVAFGQYSTAQLRNICYENNYIFMGIISKNGKNYLTNFNPDLDQVLNIKNDDSFAVIGLSHN